MNGSLARGIVYAVILGAGLHVLSAPTAMWAQEAGTPAVTVPAAPAVSPATELKKPVVAPKPIIIPYDQQIYHVSISLGVDPGIGVSDRDTQRIVDQLRSLVESRIGVWWQSRVEVAPGGEPLSRSMLAQRTAASWTLAHESTLVEKQFALTLDREGTEYRLSGVEWDRASQTVTPIQERKTYDRRLIAALATELVFNLFRPLVSIESVVDNKAELRIKGGVFVPPDLRLAPFVVGDHVSGFMRHLGKNREFKRIQVIPWTMIRIDQVELGYMRGTIVSAFKAPLAGSRRRIEMLGLKIRPTYPLTRLQVIPRGKPQSPMAGYRVEVLDRLETKDDKVPDRITMRTDRNGMVVLPADPVKPIRYLIVYSGAASLAKAPLIPGYVERLVLEAPDDAPRLNVEAETELLQSELVDLVARREVLMARARGASKKANWVLVTDLEQQVDSLPTLEQFLLRIEALKNPAVQTARRNKDKSQESRILGMCKQISEIATEHLNPQKVKDFHTEVSEEKKSQ